MVTVMELDGRPVDVDELGALALVNYGHFTSMIVDGTRVRGLDLHVVRLVHDCRAIFGVDLDPDRVRALARKVAESAQTPAVMRITVFDPDLGLGHPGSDAHPRVLISLREAGAVPPPPVRLRSVQYTRDLPLVKHVGLLGTIYHRRQAQLDGYDDVLFLRADGTISEGATWNIAFVQDGRVTWPAAECLPGVTQCLLDDAMKRLGIEIRTEPVRLTDLSDSSAAFIANAAVGLRPVHSIDGTDLATADALVTALRDEYEAIEGQPL